MQAVKLFFDAGIPQQVVPAAHSETLNRTRKNTDFSVSLATKRNSICVIRVIRVTRVIRVVRVIRVIRVIRVTRVTRVIRVIRVIRVS